MCYIQSVTRKTYCRVPSFVPTIFRAEARATVLIQDESERPTSFAAFSNSDFSLGETTRLIRSDFKSSMR